MHFIQVYNQISNMFIDIKEGEFSYLTYEQPSANQWKCENVSNRLQMLKK
jgi:hypothetical protein